MKSFGAALGFLSALPLPARWRGDGDALSRAVTWFPCVGLVFGAIAALVCVVASHLVGDMPSAALTVVTLWMLSRGLHIDGLADSADGLLSSRPRERMLEIMRDSRSGSMAIAAVVSVLLVKFAALSTLPSHTRWIAALLMPIAGRCGIVWMMAWLPYARKEDGLARIFRKPNAALVVFAFVLLAALGFALRSWLGACVAPASLLVAAVFARTCSKRLGGFTGDTLGATAELLEATVPLVLCAHWRWPA